MYKILAEILYDRFVINNKAIGLQQSNSKYKTKYLTFDSTLIERVLIMEESVLLYQQLYGSDLVKWICLDFDAKENGNLSDLIKEYVNEVTDYLDSCQIDYLLEFSGRRGIHIWILLDSTIRKEHAYEIVRAIYDVIKEKIESSTHYSVDLFPKTSVSRNNKVGLGVKMPLSKHKGNNEYSYFINNINEIFNDSDQKFTLNKKTIDNQIDIIKQTSLMNVKKLFEIFAIEVNNESTLITYKKQSTLINSAIGISEIIQGLRTCKAYDSFFSRLFVSKDLSTEDRFLILGTFGHIKPNGLEFVNELLKFFPNYDEKKTKEQIRKLKNYYYPPTMNFVHNRLGVNCNCCDKQETVLEYLRDKCDMKIQIDEESYIHDIASNTNDFINLVIKKEINYLKYNDEVTNLIVLNDLQRCSEFHISKISNLYERILQGEKIQIDEEIYVYMRSSNEKKERKMVTLSALQRIISTAIIMKLSLVLNERCDSYSYNVSPYYGNDVFYSWSNSWKNWNSKIRSYFEINLFEDYQLYKIDIKSFYDSLYVSHITKDLEEYLMQNNLDSKEVRNGLNFLVEFNDYISQTIGNGIKGVPQGPAYARYLAELYLFIALKDVKNKYNEFSWYRYVDDIYIFGKPETDMGGLRDDIAHVLKYKSLRVNDEKTSYYPRIGSISKGQQEKMYNFYNARNTIQDMSTYINEKEVFEYDYYQKLIDDFLKRNERFDINDFNFLITDRILPSVRMSLIKRNIDIIFSSTDGRGSVFSKIYQYIFRNIKILEYVENKMIFKKIPINSINMKVFLSELLIELEEDNNGRLLDFAQIASKEINKSENLDLEVKVYIETIFGKVEYYE